MTIEHEAAEADGSGIAAETMHGDLMALVLDELKAAPDVWQKLGEDEQRKGCAGHRYIPALITFAEQVDANAGENWIEYRMPDGRTFRNGAPGPNSYTSEELRAMDPAMIGDPTSERLRAEFDARHVEAA